MVDASWMMDRMGALCAGIYQVRGDSPPLTLLSTPRIDQNHRTEVLVVK
jgi:hypothetical protein